MDHTIYIRDTTTGQEKTFNWIMTTAVLLILAIPVGFANIWLGYIIGESPCTLCWYQRIGMIVIGALGLCILRYGPKIKYVSTILLFGAYGIYMGLRHTAGHTVRDIGMGLGDKILGAHTYTWSLFVYWVVIIFMGAMLIFLTRNSALLKALTEPEPRVKKLTRYTSIVLILSIIVVASNAFQALFLNGIPPYTGKSNPDRLSLNLLKMSQTWTPAVWNRLTRASLVGKNTIEEPYIPWVIEPSDVEISQGFDQGAVASAPKATVVSQEPIDSYIIGTHTKYPIMAAAYDPKTNEVALITNELGAYYMDPELKGVKEYAIFDKPNGMDMKYIVGATYAGQKLIIAAFNKTIVGIQKVDEPLDPIKQWQTFKETTGKLSSVFGRSRPGLVSIRGKQQYIDGLASDGRYLYTITLPNRWNKQLVLQKFDTKDFKLSSETIVTAAPDLKLENGRTLDDYYVSGLAYENGKLYAISPRYSSLLVLNPATAEVEKIYELEGSTAPRSPYFRDGKMYVLDYKNGRDYIDQVNIPAN